MRRTPMQRRTPLRTKRREGPTSPRERHLVALTPSRSLHRAVMGGATGPAQPKSAPHRNRRLLDLAAGKPCLLLVPGICSHRTDTTVACHSNLSIHGKAGARKADDEYTVWGCSACHAWLDQGDASAGIKTMLFMDALGRQALAYRQLANDPSTPPADRRAYLWALDLLAEPTGVPA